MNNLPSILILPKIQAKDKTELLAAIATAAAADPLLKTAKADQLQQKLEKREKLISTAVGSGVAIPHCFVEELETFVIGLATLAAPIKFDAPDGNPVDLFFFIFAPVKSRNQHIKILSDISRAARQSAVRQTLREANDEQSINAVLSQHLRLKEVDPESPRCQFQIFIQNQQLFEPILEEISVHVAGSIAVQELKTAGSYLNRMPLFSALWSERTEQQVKMISATVEKPLVNELTRRIHQIAGNDNELKGISITVHDLIYQEGSIDF